MATRPALPPDDEPLDAASVDLLLSHMGEEMVLVGGQALAFWMDRFGVETQGVAVSNDGDALGSVALTRILASAIDARVVLPDARSLTSLVAQLRLPAGGGKERNVDILHLLYTVGGLKKSAEFTRRVIRDSVRVEWRPGKFIRVMDPFDVLESRVQNAAGLVADKGPHVVTQARWAVRVVREALLRLAHADKSAERVGARIQSIYTLAKSKAGRALLADHGVEILEAIDVAKLRGASPLHARQLEAVRKSQAARRKAAGKSTSPRRSS